MENKLIKATVCILALLGAMVLLAVLKQEKKTAEGRQNMRYLRDAF